MRAILFLLALALSSPLGRAAAITGQQAPGFTLTDIEGHQHALSDYRGKTVVLEWINHSCPFVVRHYDSGNMPALQKEAADNGVIWLSICSSAEGKQGHHSPEEWRALNREKQGAATAVLLDEHGQVGRLYGAKTTPHMYIISPEGILLYQGGIDDSPHASLEKTALATNYIRAALADIAAGRAVQIPYATPYGCGVKY